MTLQAFQSEDGNRQLFVEAVLPPATTPCNPPSLVVLSPTGRDLLSLRAEQSRLLHLLDARGLPPDLGGVDPRHGEVAEEVVLLLEEILLVDQGLVTRHEVSAAVGCGVGHLLLMRLGRSLGGTVHAASHGGLV